MISIFRIFGLGYSQFNRVEGYHPLKVAQRQNINDMIFDNFVQIKTGEGKSVTLAAVSIIFALYGYEVNCACYSQYLSERDYKDFLDIFNELGITDRIFYGTFNMICERFINEKG